MADSDKNTRRIDPGRNPAESAKPLGKATSGKTKTDTKPLKEQDAEWGFEAKKSGMATEAKMGMGIVVILVCAFGFLVYNKFELKQRQLMQVKGTSSGDGETTEIAATEIAATDSSQSAAPFYSADTTTDQPVAQAPLQPVGVQGNGNAQESLIAAERSHEALDKFAALTPESTVDEQAFDLEEPELIASASPFGDAPTDISSADEPLTELADRLEAMSAAKKETQTEEPGFVATLDNTVLSPPDVESFDPFENEPIVADSEPAFDRFENAPEDDSSTPLSPVEEDVQVSAAPTEADFSAFDERLEVASASALPPVAELPTEQMDVAEIQESDQANEPEFRSLFERDIAPNAATKPSPPIDHNSASAASVTDVTPELKFDEDAVANDRFLEEPQTLAELEPSEATDASTRLDEFSEFTPDAVPQEQSAAATGDPEPTDPSTLIAMLDKPQSGGLFPAEESASEVIERRSIVPDKERERFSSGDDFSLPSISEDEKSEVGDFPVPSEPTIEVPLPRDSGLQIQLPRAPAVTQPKSGISVPHTVTQPSLRMPVVQDVIPNDATIHQEEDGHAHILLPGTDGVRQVAASSDDIDVIEVKPNDTYWAISKRAYGTSRYFAALALYNQNRIRDPKRLRPGMKVLLPTPEAMEDKYPELFRSSRRKAKLPRGYFLQQDGTPAYRIGERETLSMISQKHLGRASRWMQIYRLNRNILRDPNKLKPGTVIALPDDATDVHLAP